MLKKILSTVERRLNQTSYAERVANELHNHSGVFKQNDSTDEIRRFSWKVTAFEYAMKCYAPYLVSQMPHINIDSYVAERMAATSGPVRILALGCATGDWELQIARKNPDRCDVTLVDLNAELLEEGKRYGEKHGLKVDIIAGDVNTLKIQPEHFDFIVCRSSLHHFIMLEDVLQQIRQGLKEDGRFLVIGEWIGRNGLQLYPETEVIANAMFSILPDRLRLNEYTKEIDKKLPNIDHSVNCFEAVRSEEILPAVLEIFKPIEYVAFDTLVTSFFDFRYGSNYKDEDERDREFVERITAADIEYLVSGTLRPTAMFGIFER